MLFLCQQSEPAKKENAQPRNITLSANERKTEIESIEQEILEELKKLNFIEKSEIISCIAKIKKEKTDI